MATATTQEVVQINLDVDLIDLAKSDPNKAILIQILRLLEEDRKPREVAPPPGPTVQINPNPATPPA